MTVTVDRPLGSRRPEHPDIVYPVNYGYIADEEQDAYILGVDVPAAAFTGEVAACIRRLDDSKDKWVIAPPGMRLTAPEIARQMRFTERYFTTEIEMTTDE